MSAPHDELQVAIDEETKKAKWRKLWDQFGVYLILIFTFIVGGAAIWAWQQNRAHKNAFIYSNIYEEARSLFSHGQIGEAVQKLQEIIKKGPVNYRTMARFILIDYYTSMHNKTAMYQVYQDIHNDKQAPDFYRELAQINLIRFKLDNEQPTKEALQGFITTLTKLHNPSVKKMALEIEGFIYYELKDFTKAREIYTQLAQMPEIDHEMRNRAQAMVRLIYMETVNAKKN